MTDEASFRTAIEQAEHLIAAARVSADALALEMRRAQHGFLGHRRLLQRITAASPWPLQDPSAQGTATEDAGEGRTFAAVTELIEQIERGKGARPDAIDDLITHIKSAITSDADPCVLMGVLLEGIVQTLVQRIPDAEHADTLVALVDMLRIRLARPDGAPG